VDVKGLVATDDLEVREHGRCFQVLQVALQGLGPLRQRQIVRNFGVEGGHDADVAADHQLPVRKNVCRIGEQLDPVTSKHRHGRNPIEENSRVILLYAEI